MSCHGIIDWHRVACNALHTLSYLIICHTELIDVIIYLMKIVNQ